MFKHQNIRFLLSTLHTTVYAIIITVTSICTRIHLLGYFVYYHKYVTKIKYAQEGMGFRRNIVLNLPNSSLTWHPAGPSPTKESHRLFFEIYGL